eukprot:COSAG02_NODE_1963_length_10250_cov_112.556300_2_plen_182_part_00
MSSTLPSPVADHNAVPFFAKQGFNDDKILNSRYISYLDDDWDQSILMSYTRPRAAVAASQRSISAYGAPDTSGETKKAKLAARIEGWKATRMEEYSSQLQLVEQVRVIPGPQTCCTHLAARVFGLSPTVGQPRSIRKQSKAVLIDWTSWSTRSPHCRTRLPRLKGGFHISTVTTLRCDDGM